MILYRIAYVSTEQRVLPAVRRKILPGDIWDLWVGFLCVLWDFGGLAGIAPGGWERAYGDGGCTDGAPGDEGHGGGSRGKKVARGMEGGPCSELSGHHAHHGLNEPNLYLATRFHFITGQLGGSYYTPMAAAAAASAAAAVTAAAPAVKDVEALLLKERKHRRRPGDVPYPVGHSMQLSN